MRTIVLLVVAAALAGCTGLGLSTSAEMTYIRADGQPVAQEQLDADLSGCSSLFDSTKTNNCMMAKGYFQVEVKDAAAKQAQFAQIAEDKRRQEEARILAERKKQEALDRAARKKAKKKPKQPVPRQ